MSQGNYDLHVLALIVVAVVSFLVVIVMFYSIVRHRKQMGESVKQFHRSPMVEILWTAIPILIMLGLTVPAAKVLIQRKETVSPGISVEAMGYRWRPGDIVENSA